MSRTIPTNCLLSPKTDACRYIKTLSPLSSLQWHCCLALSLFPSEKPDAVSLQSIILASDVNGEASNCGATHGTILSNCVSSIIAILLALKLCHPCLPAFVGVCCQQGIVSSCVKKRRLHWRHIATSKSAKKFVKFVRQTINIG